MASTMKSAVVARTPVSVSSKKATKCVAVCKAAAPARAFAGNTKAFSAKVFKGQARRMTTKMSATGYEQVGESYAGALAEVAVAKNSLKAVYEDMETLESVLDESVTTFLSNPLIPDQKKKEVVIKISEKGKFTPYTTNFLKLLVDKGRMNALGAVISAFDSIYCQKTDTEVASVTSAVTLDSEEQFLIAKELQKLTGAKNIKLKPSVDESLIGGFVIRYGENGSSLIDQSIKGKFEAMEAQLLGAQ